MTGSAIMEVWLKIKIKIKIKIKKDISPVFYREFF